MKQHLATAKKPIEGRAIQEIVRMERNKVLLKFKDGDQCTLDVWGDCCSDSVFYEIVFPKKCARSEILSICTDAEGEEEKVAVEKASKANLDWFSEENQVFDVVFTTRKGEIRIRHINSSNGYYGGYVSFGEIEPQQVVLN